MHCPLCGISLITDKVEGQTGYFWCTNSRCQIDVVQIKTDGIDLGDLIETLGTKLS